MKVANFEFYNRLRNLQLSKPLAQLRTKVLKNLHLLGWAYQYGFTPDSLRQNVDSQGFENVEVKPYSLSPYSKNSQLNIIRHGINLISDMIYKSTGQIISPWLELYAYNEKKLDRAIIRQFSEQDQPFIKQFVMSVLEEFGYQNNPWYDFDLNDLKSSYLDSGGTFLVLSDGQEIKGTIGIAFKGEEAELKRFYIAHNLRGHNYGETLIRKAIEYCNQRGITTIKLSTTSRFSHAQRLYQKYGFRLIKQEGENIYFERKIDNNELNS